MAKRNKKYPKYPNGGKFFNKAGEIATNYGLGMADTVLGTVGMSNVIKDDQYKGAGSQFFRGYSDVAGAVGKAALPMAANIIAPGSGQFVSAGQQAVGQFNPEDPSQLDKDPRTTQMIGNSLGTVAGPAMQLAMMRNGGQMNNMAELEKNEAFQLPNGNSMQLNNAPSHEQGGVVIPNLPEGTRILSDKLKTSNKKTYAEEYKPFQKLKDMANKLPDGKAKQDMLNKADGKFEELYNEQETMKEQKFASQLERDMYRCGGMIKHKDGGIYIKPSNRGKFEAAAKRAGMSSQDYVSHILTNSIQRFQNGGIMGGDPVKKGKSQKVDVVPQGYNYNRTEGTKTFYSKEADKAITSPSGGKTPPSSDWEDSIIQRLQSGVSPESLVEQGHISQGQIDKFRPYYKELYTEKTNIDLTQPSGIPLDVSNRINRKLVNSGMTGIEAYEYPDVNAGYSNPTRWYTERTTGKFIDPSSVYIDEKTGQYDPSKLSYIEGPQNVLGTMKSEAGQNLGVGQELQETKNINTNTMSSGFRYGGIMKKYSNGGPYDEQGAVMTDEYGNQILSNKYYGYSNPINPTYYTGPTDMRDDEMPPPVDFMREGIYNNSLSPVSYGQFTANETPFYRPTSDRETGFGDPEPKPTFTNIPSEGEGSNIPWQRIAGQAALGIGQNIGNIYDLARANKVEDTSYTRINPAQLSPTAALNYNNVQQRKLAEDIRDASVGKSSTYLNARRDAAINAMRTNAQIREDFENRNAMLRQQAEQYNAATSDRESDANAMNRATARNIKGHAYSNIGQNIMNQRRDVGLENRDQQLANMLPHLYNDPNFKKFLINSGYIK